MTNEELIKQLQEGKTSNKIVIAKKKKRGGYTLFPQVVEVVHTVVPIIGTCDVIVYED